LPGTTCLNGTAKILETKRIKVGEDIIFLSEGRRVADDTWTEIAGRLEDPDDQQDPWQATRDPWVANVYQSLLSRRQERA
jgi:hypothetical protein